MMAPPRAAVRLLDAVLPDAERDDIVGHLVEVFADRVDAAAGRSIDCGSGATPSPSRPRGDRAGRRTGPSNREEEWSCDVT